MRHVIVKTKMGYGNENNQIDVRKTAVNPVISDYGKYIKTLIPNNYTCERTNLMF